MSGVAARNEHDPELTTFTQIDTSNTYGVHVGENMPNHTAAMQGKGRYVKFGVPTVVFRSQQDVYRFAAWLVVCAEGHLFTQQEEGEHTFEEILEAVRNA